MRTEYCKYFIKGNCDKENCRYIHDSNICRHFFLKGKCRDGDNCKYKHIKFNNKRKKNTECFEPSHKEPDMRIIVENGGNFYPRKYKKNDVILVHNLFCDKDDFTIYNNLLAEIKETKIDNDKLWKLWHGDTHLIVDDKQKWKDNCPTFNMVIQKIKSYFNIDVKATRFNLYEDSTHWKPFHHDAAAVKKDKMHTQNTTIGVSFGLEREAAFEHAKHKNVLSIPLCNGSIYVFNKDVNIDWKHGILQMDPQNIIKEGRISIIAWGYINME